MCPLTKGFLHAPIIFIIDRGHHLRGEVAFTIHFDGLPDYTLMWIGKHCAVKRSHRYWPVTMNALGTPNHVELLRPSVYTSSTVVETRTSSPLSISGW